jgi:predicted dehydrogenase
MNTRPALRLAVIGVGHVGRHHARILAGLDDVQVVAVVDLIRARAEEAARPTGARACTDYREVLGQVDAVTVAVPTISHELIARPFLERGAGVLVEKPMAAEIEEADALIATAAASGAVLAVGHSERFNPAVRAAAPLVTTPRFIEVHRLSGFPDRSLDVDVVFDVMIHDLDVILSLVDSEVAGIEAVGVPVLTDRFDLANARLRFASGCIANITASRISRDTIRKIRFFQPDMYLSVDYAGQEVEAWRLVRGDGPRPSIEGGSVPVTRGEPLALELADFVGAVRERRAPLVSGVDGRRALALAQRIAKEMDRGTGGPS